MPPKKRNRDTTAIKEEIPEELDELSPEQLKRLVMQERREKVDLEAELEVAKEREEKLWLERIMMRVARFTEGSEYIETREDSDISMYPNYKVLEIPKNAHDMEIARKVLEKEDYLSYSCGVAIIATEYYFVPVPSASEVVRIFGNGLDVGTKLFNSMEEALNGNDDAFFVLTILTDDDHVPKLQDDGDNGSGARILTKEIQKYCLPMSASANAHQFNAKLLFFLCPDMPSTLACSGDDFAFLCKFGESYPQEVQQQVKNANYDSVIKEVWVPDTDTSTGKVKRRVRVDLDLNRMLEVRPDGVTRPITFGVENDEMEREYDEAVPVQDEIDDFFLRHA